MVIMSFLFLGGGGSWLVICRKVLQHFNFTFWLTWLHCKFIAKVRRHGFLLQLLTEDIEIRRNLDSKKITNFVCLVEETNWLIINKPEETVLHKLINHRNANAPYMQNIISIT